MTVTKTPYITYDPEIKAAYLRLSNNKVNKTREFSEDINIDFDRRGRVVGVEVLWIKSAKLKIRRQIKKVAKNYRIPALRYFHPEKLGEVFSLT